MAKHAARVHDDVVQEAGRIIAEAMYRHRLYFLTKIARIATKNPDAWPQEIPNT